jgi:hypothetical protein
MTREDIIRMAREAWLMDKHDCSDDWFVRADIDEKNIFEFAALVAAHEREACAKVCDKVECGSSMMIEERHTANECARKIRAR